MEMTELQQGEYRVPQGHTARVKGGVVRIEPREDRTDYARCRFCAHYELGHTFHSNGFRTYVCMMRPKSTRDYRRDREEPPAHKCYYARSPYSPACADFRRREL